MADADFKFEPLSEPDIVEDAPPTTIVRIRGVSAQTLANTLGVPLPEIPNTISRVDGVEACWLGPGEWVVFGRPPQQVANDLARICGDANWHAANMTDAWVRWRISGSAAPVLLSKGCSLDLHPRVFGPDKCARTLLGQVNVLVMRTELGWAVHAERALAEHLRVWFGRARQEFLAGRTGVSSVRSA